eukprot:CAMPEP_0202901070 /NCGR_PEP_ID=MMETSP1392-20130828/13091_1 /ASSEMBLY_ACC=CAM_ASM_000868 /TAXON_ID=225041 /ORGANISM="Chlamydomonas chlamydogama, Strain SAG 11-48b" /LENGTH=159 /DNA_ID=CAMNT_0049587563 /DNA_START=147 /DNA_END=627 /DNA_ORIENTATION=+
MSGPLDPLIANQRVEEHQERIDNPPRPSTQGRVRSNVSDFANAFCRLSCFSKSVRIAAVASVVVAGILAGVAFYKERTILNGALVLFAVFGVLREIADSIDAPWQNKAFMVDMHNAAQDTEQRPHNCDNYVVGVSFKGYVIASTVTAYDKMPGLPAGWV